MRTVLSICFGVVAIALCGPVWSQCAGGGAGGGSTSSFQAAGATTSQSGVTTSARSAQFPSVSFSAGQVPQVGGVRSPSNSGTGMVQSFQAQQMLNYRALAASGVRNRTSAARRNEMLATNAERAYRAGLSAEKSGRVYSAVKQYERAAAIAPGTLAASYAEEAISRLTR